MRDQQFNLRCHQPCVIPPSSAPTVFDEKMRMVTLTRHHYYVPDGMDTTLSTFSRVEKVALDARASELVSRASFPAKPNATDTWHDLKLRAGAHENVPIG